MLSVLDLEPNMDALNAGRFYVVVKKPESFMIHSFPW